MARTVRWTESAWSDLEQIREYVARDSEHYAACLVREIRDAARSLAILSERGRKVPELHIRNLRELFIKRYRLIYQVAPGSVYIVGIIHGARDLSALWDKEGR